MPSRRPAERIEEIIDNIEAIHRYTTGLDESGFIANTLVVDAVERCLSRIAEAAAKLGALAPQLMPDQPWHNIRGLGNRLRHDYDVINPRDLWTIVVESLPPLRTACQHALRQLGDSTR
ncbi:MAG TPA: HepT-like ribonuclease domain-containing protein [Xanthobacteraceae bacterium]